MEKLKFLNSIYNNNNRIKFKKKINMIQILIKVSIKTHLISTIIPEILIKHQII